MSGNQRGRGGAGGRGRGRGRGRGGMPPNDRPVGPPAGPRPGPNPKGRSPPDMSGLKLDKSKVAVDGTPLEMAKRKPTPARNPVPGNLVDTKSFDKLLEDIRAHGSQAEFPLRKMFHATSTTVYTNHFAMQLDPKMPLYEYEIKGLPARVGKKTSRILVHDMIDNIDFLKNHQNEFATDYVGSIISWIKLPEEALQNVAVSSREGRNTVDLYLWEKGIVETDLLKQYTEGKAQPNKDTRERIQSVNRILNMVISKALSQDSFSLKANKFFVTGGHTPLGASLCAMRGYFYSIKPGMGQILLTLNACTSAFYQPILVSQFLSDANTIRNKDERLSVLRGLRVHLTYDPKHSGKPRSRAAIIEASMKTIEGNGLPCNKQKFTLKGRDGKPDEVVTVEEHFQRTYNKTLQFPQMPAINCGTQQKERWYPPEVLQILPYQIYKRKVPESLTRNMLDVACHHPADTRALIEHEGLRELGLSPSGGFAPFAACPPVLIDSRMLKVPAAVLSYPVVNYGKNGKVTFDGQAKNGKWNLVGRTFTRSNVKASFKVFMIVVPREGRSDFPSTVTQDVWNGFQTAARDYATGTFALVGETICPLFTNLEIAHKVMTLAKSKGANFVFLLLENKSTQAYSNLKDLADRTFGMQSLCAVYKLDKRTQLPFGGQQWGNLMMKVNLKAGGLNHTSPDVSKLMADTLVLGADVTHPGPGSLIGTPSIAAIVGSIDKESGKFLGSMRLQPRDTACEDIKDVEGMVLERIRAWFSMNKTMPKNILYYRDGVADSQYSQVQERELPQIRKAFTAAAKLAKVMMVPKFNLTAIVVAKRHHVRFFPGTDDADYAVPKYGNGKESNGNCAPGTLVDTVVTSPYFQDFYLQSHDGIKGTAKSAHYFVLVNEMGLSETELQEFTHALCYTYVRATMGVSYAPPAYYADRLCERGRCYLRNFLAPEPEHEFTLGHKKMRESLKEQRKVAREAKFKPMRTVDDRTGKKVKTDAEKLQEEKDEEDVEKEVKRRTLAMAGTKFYGPDHVVRNPWHGAIAGTMFWM